MTEIAAQIDDLLTKGITITELHKLLKEIEILANIFWRQVLLCIKFQLWTGELAIQAGEPANELVIGYFTNLQDHVLNQLFILKDPPVKN